MHSFEFSFDLSRQQGPAIPDWAPQTLVRSPGGVASLLQEPAWRVIRHYRPRGGETGVFLLLRSGLDRYARDLS